MNKKILALSVAGLCSTSIFAGVLDDLEYYNFSQDGAMGVKIINGESAALSDYPYYARLIVSDNTVESQLSTAYADFCGASILDDQHILTAAHCLSDVTDAQLPYVGVVVNNAEAGDGKVDVTEVKVIDSVSIHSGYNTTTFQDDIAVIKLKDKITDSITAIDIPSSSDVTYYNALDSLTAIGMGATTVVDNGDGTYGYDDPSTTLLKTDLDNTDDATCKTDVESKYAGGAYDSDTQICAYSVVVDSIANGVCNGDSGGPLTYTDSNGDYKQAGIVSYGVDKCDETEAPQVFTEVAGYSSWITNIMTGETDSDSPTLTNEGNFSDGGGGSFGLFGLFGLGGLLAFRRKNKK